MPFNLQPNQSLEQPERVAMAQPVRKVTDSPYLGQANEKDLKIIELQQSVDSLKSRVKQLSQALETSLF